MSWDDMVVNHVIGLYYDGRGWGLFIVAGWVLAVIGFCRLLAYGKYLRFFTSLLVYSGIACLLYFGLQWAITFEDGDARLWASMPLILLVIVFALSGFFMYSHVDKVLAPKGGIRRPPSRLSIRLVGAILAAVGLGIWYYGVLHPYEGPLLYVAVAASLYPMIFGFPYLLTGRRCRDWDK